MVHLHIHLDARAWGNDGLEQIRSARAFAQLRSPRTCWRRCYPVGRAKPARFRFDPDRLARLAAPFA